MHPVQVILATILLMATITSANESANVTSQLVYAFDITTLDLFAELNHTDIPWNAPSTISPLFRFTWTNTSNIFGRKQIQFPDQVTDVQYSHRPPITKTLTFTNLLDYQADLQAVIGTGSEDDGTMSLSSRFRMGQKQLLAGQPLVCISQSFLRISVRLADPEELQVTEQFQEMIDNLSGRYLDDPEPFQKLLNTFGTHYFTQHHFGAYWLTRIAIDDDYFYLKGAMSVRNTAIGYFNRLNTPDNPDFVPPGDFLAAHPQITNGRWGTVKHPWLIGATRGRPISTLIGDEAIKEQVQIAIEVKMAKAYLQQLVSSLELMTGNDRINWLYMGRWDLVRVQAKVKRLLGERVPSFEDLEQTKKEVNWMVNLATDGLLGA